MGAMTYHMMITLNQELRFKTDYSVAKFREIRIAAGKSEQSTDEENQECADLLDQMYECWTDVEHENGQELHYPKSMKEIATARKLLVKVIDIAPTDSNVVDLFVNYAQIVKEKTDREFDGSGMLLGLSAVMALGILVLMIMSISSGGGNLLQMIFSAALPLLMWGVPCGIYFLACRTPGFMLEFRKNKKPSRFKFVNTIIAIIFGVGVAGLKMDLGGGTTWYTVYSDGRKEYDTGMNMMQLFLNLGIKAFIALCVLFLLFIISLSVILWAFINYLRNYVLFK